MLSSSSKSGTSNVANNRIAAASRIKTQRSAKLDSATRSPRPGDLKPATVRSSSTISSSHDKHSPLKKLEAQAELAAVQENLKKAKQQLASKAKEKALVLEELSIAKKEAEEVSVKLSSALLSQKRAEESWALEKLRTDKLEQSGFEASRKWEDELIKELEDIRHQHAIVSASLISTYNDLQRMEEELVMATAAMNSALSQADDSKKLREINAEKVEALLGEIHHLEFLLESRSNEATQMMEKLGSEAEALKLELEKANVTEEKVAKMEALAEGLKFELRNSKRVESDAVGEMDELKKKAELLESLLEQAKESEMAVLESLAFRTMQLEDKKSALRDAESEVMIFTAKVEALELEADRTIMDLKESDHLLDLCKQKVLNAERTISDLKPEFLKLEEEKERAKNIENQARLSAQVLTQKNSKLASQLGIVKEESDKAKKATEGLALAFREVTIESRNIQDRILFNQAEIESISCEADKLRFALKNTQERYEVMIDEAKYEIVCLKKAIDKFETEAENSRATQSAKEIDLRSAIKKKPDEIVSSKIERDQAIGKLERQEIDAKALEEVKIKLLNSLRQAESELSASINAIEKVKYENKCLKERLLDKENELQSINQENDSLRVRAIYSSEKMIELSESITKLLQTKREKPDGKRVLLNDKKAMTNSETLSVEKQEFFKDRKIEEDDNKKAKFYEVVKASEVQFPYKYDHDSVGNELKSTIRGKKVSVKNDQSVSSIKHMPVQKQKKVLQNLGGFLKKKTASK